MPEQSELFTPPASAGLSCLGRISLSRRVVECVDGEAERTGASKSEEMKGIRALLEAHRNGGERVSRHRYTGHSILIETNLGYTATTVKLEDEGP